nr:immunoglobulin light chain junction region [Macaca mulatta]
CQQHNSCPLTF